MGSRSTVSWSGADGLVRGETVETHVTCFRVLEPMSCVIDKNGYYKDDKRDIWSVHVDTPLGPIPSRECGPVQNCRARCFRAQRQDTLLSAFGCGVTVKLSPQVVARLKVQASDLFKSFASSSRSILSLGGKFLDGGICGSKAGVESFLLVTVTYSNHSA